MIVSLIYIKDDTTYIKDDYYYIKDMEVEEVVNILGKVQDKNLIPVRTLRMPSSIAKSYRTYIMQLWWLTPEHDKIMLFSVEETGLYNDEHKKELVRKTEEKFYEKLFKAYNAYFPERFEEHAVSNEAHIL